VSDIPADLLDSLVREAELDAHRVAVFLSVLGIAADPDRPIRLPRGSLLALGAALRLLEWEDNGLNVHRDAGLPPAHQALLDALRSLNSGADDEARGTHHLSRRVVALFAERLAWHGRRELDADVALDELDDEAMLEALAEFLWASRQAGRAPSDAPAEPRDE
jgi:hypothetical protein